MKKWLLLILIPLFAFGCATTGLENRVAELESRMEIMEITGGAEQTAASFYPATALTGGGTGALDKITGVSEGDVAMVALEDDGTYGD